MREWIPRFQAYLEAESASANTLRAYIRDLEAFRTFVCERLGRDARVGEVDLDLMRLYLARRSKIRERSTVARELTSLKSFWRFLVREESITLSTDDLNDSYGISKRLDCGIAMLHIEVACRVHGIAGGWRFLDPPGVATWQIEQSDAIPEADVIERGISPIRGNAWPALRRRT